ncbi:MAG: hypothetical protein ABJF10_12065 [Chthoniobacter sp.]|uniref:hypothetical protein n=1 Tax=Chthoniobacter sp. TaxID=2510640 RepID=UPI0032A68804
MKARDIYLPLVALALIVSGVYVYFFTGPYRFVDAPLAPESLQHLRSGAGSGAAWLASPSETTLEYLNWWPQLDRPNLSRLDIATLYRSPEEAVVTIIDNDTRDDSISRSCDRLTLRRQGGVWIPVRHQAAWQGRGRFGWTTQPTS